MYRTISRQIGETRERLRCCMHVHVAQAIETYRRTSLVETSLHRGWQSCTANGTNELQPRGTRTETSASELCSLGRIIAKSCFARKFVHDTQWKLIARKGTREGGGGRGGL